MINKYLHETEYRLLALFECLMIHRLKVIGRADSPEYKNNNFKNANTLKSMFLTVINYRINEDYASARSIVNRTFTVN